MFGFNRAKRTFVAATVTAAAAAAALLNAPAAVAAPQPIVGGTTTTASAYPYVMQITNSSQNQFCGGTLVSATKVVTAAHCLVDETASSIRVVGGRTYRNGTNGTVRTASKIWIHPSYNSSTMTSDVAVLTLAVAQPYTTASYVSASQTGVYAAGSTARIIGWGTTSSGRSSSNQLRTATVPVVADSVCGSSSSYGSEFVASSMVCAGYSSGGVDTCQGDSGGPLMIGGVLAGIVSWGYGCADAQYPGIYTRLTTFSNTVAAQIAS